MQIKVNNKLVDVASLSDSEVEFARNAAHKYNLYMMLDIYEYKIDYRDALAEFCKQFQEQNGRHFWA